MDLVIKFWKQVLSFFIFISMVTSCIFLSENINTMLQTSANNLYNNGILYKNRKEKTRDLYYLTRNEVIAYFMSPIEYDTVLDGNIVKAKDYNYMQFDFSLIKKETYQLQYQYNRVGEITFVQLIGR